MSKFHIVPTWNLVKPTACYVYLHIRVSDDLVFYVGKGQDKRGWASYPRDRSPHWRNVANKHGCRIEVCQDGMSEDDAHTLEMILIARLRHEGHPLVNQTDGGEGMSGLSPSVDTRLKLRDAQGGRTIYCSNGMSFPITMDAVRWLIGETGKPAFSGPISKCARGKGLTSYGYAWSFDAVPAHPEYSGRESARQNAKRPRSAPMETSLGDYFDNLTRAIKWLRENGYPKASHSAIIESLRSPTLKAYGRLWWRVGEDPKIEMPPDKKEGGKRRAVVRSDGTRYPSLTRAANELHGGKWENPSSGVIHKAIVTKGTAYGYAWWYEGDDPVAYEPKRGIASRKRISRGDGVEYDAMTDAVNWLRGNGWPKASPSGLTHACKGGTRAYGYTWRYL